MGGIGDFIFGKSPKIKQMDNFDPQQNEYLGTILQMLQQQAPQVFDYINSILSGEDGAFDDYEAPIKQQFEEETIPNILERFRGSGSKNSSGLQNTLGSAGRKLSTDLSAQRANLRNSVLGHLQNLSGTALQPKTTSYATGGKNGLIDYAAQGIGNAMPGILKSAKDFGSSIPGLIGL